jgi:hypothetical protein
VHAVTTTGAGRDGDTLAGVALLSIADGVDR